MLNQILNRLTSSGSAQGRRTTAGRGRSATGGGFRRRGSRQSAPAQTLVSRLLRRR